MPQDSYFIHFLTWVELGPLGSKDPHFDITPSQPGSGVAEAEPGHPADNVHTAGKPGAPVHPSKNQSRQDQRDAERNMHKKDVASAVMDAANTAANRAAQDAAEREILDVASRVRLTP